MRAMVYTRPGTLEILDVDAPEVQPGEILVDVAACGICGSELHGIGAPATPTDHGPRVLRHCLARSSCHGEPAHQLR